MNIIKELQYIIPSMLIVISIIQFFSIGSIYYVSFFLILIIFHKRFRYVKINKSVLLFLFVCYISIVFNDIPSVIQPIPRFIIYSLIFLLLSPLLVNSQLYFIRKRILEYLLYFCTAISLISFVLFILFGIGIDEKDLGFKGITGFSMMMAPISAFSILFLIYKYKQTKQFSLLIFILICIIVHLMAGSRSALVATIISLLTTTFMESISKFTKVLLTAIIILLITFPLWQPLMSVYETKMEIQEERMDGENSRSKKWNNRLDEFSNNPIIGIGFCSLDVVNNSNDYNSEDGTMEPGSSWLAVLSMLGITGFLVFSYIYLKAIVNYITSKESGYFEQLSFQMLIFFGLHFIFEGYLFGVGSILLVLFLLSLSLTTDIKYNKQII